MEGMEDGGDRGDGLITCMSKNIIHVGVWHECKVINQ